MIISFIEPGTATGAVAYVTGKIDSRGRPRPRDPQILGGSVDRFKAAVEYSSLRFPFHSVVLSYWENSDSVDPVQMVRHARDFAKLLRGGLPEDRLPWLAVGHSRADGCDTHILQAKTDLLTHRPVSTWCNTADEKQLFNTWRRQTNLECDLFDPDDRWHLPFRAEPPDDLSTQDRKDFRAANLSQIVIASEGWIDGREDLFTCFLSRGYSDPSLDDEGIDVRAPSGRRVRFQGGMYADGFDHWHIHRARQKERGPKQQSRELRRLRERLNRLKGRRYMEFERRYGMKSVAVQRTMLARLLAAQGTGGPAPAAKGSTPSATPANQAATSAAPDAVAGAASEKTNHHGNQHTEQHPGAILRIIRNRRLFAQGILRAVADPVSRAVEAINGAGEAHSRARELARELAGDIRGELERGIGRLLEGCRSLEQSGGEIGDQAGGRGVGEGVRRHLEHVRSNCQRAQGSVAPLISIAAERELISERPRGMRPIPMPQVQPEQGFSHAI